MINMWNPHGGRGNVCDSDSQSNRLAGTHHFGLRPIKDKDIVKMEIDKIGTLQVDVNDPLNRTWPED